HALAAEAEARHPGTRFIGLTEPEISTAQPGDRYPGDHAAKYETSIALALAPEWVRLDRLTPGRDPARVALPETPRHEGPQWQPDEATYAIWGQDPRTSADLGLGSRLVGEIVERLVEQVALALAEAGEGHPTATASPSG